MTKDHNSNHSKHIVYSQLTLRMSCQTPTVSPTLVVRTRLCHSEHQLVRQIRTYVLIQFFWQCNNSNLIQRLLITYFALAAKLAPFTTPWCPGRTTGTIKTESRKNCTWMRRSQPKIRSPEVWMISINLQMTSLDLIWDTSDTKNSSSSNFKPLWTLKSPIFSSSRVNCFNSRLISLESRRNLTRGRKNGETKIKQR